MPCFYALKNRIFKIIRFDKVKKYIWLALPAYSIINTFRFDWIKQVHFEIFGLALIVTLK